MFKLITSGTDMEAQKSLFLSGRANYLSMDLSSKNSLGSSKVYQRSFSQLLTADSGHSTTMWTEFFHFLTPSPSVDNVLNLSMDKNTHFFIPSPYHLKSVNLQFNTVGRRNDDMIVPLSGPMIIWIDWE